ncbi:hypothetical protein BCR35DRAFT_354204 [Leucosporidium creatinivorum]|uniref:Oxysterol-binding protein n=1 Tax=Leucosporidium creatinivorum TaxID=106004 RepID=A0A1Y2ENE0_9BASI|nr:hypothetical protein BCR35DRAFT_354204 [Leucosporidium creatinivorum]
MSSLLKGRLSRASSSKSAVSTPDTQSLNDGDLPSTDGSPSLLPADAANGELLDATKLGLSDPDPATADNSDSGKFRQLLGILRKALNVKDLSSLRISLPASLMEPVGNLEVWNYVDRPDFFCAMGESEDELERMLGVVRWTFTKDLKFVKNKIAKPYNSVLGEHFHCHFDTSPVPLHPETRAPEPHLHIDDSPSTEILSNAGRTPSKAPATSTSTTSLPTSAGTTVVASSAGSMRSDATANSSARVVFLNEQTSHHPPISHFMLESRGPKGRVRCVGADQLSAKFTGTNVKVFPGPWNRGLYVSFPDRGDEEYQITHPTATVAGLLRGAPYATIGEHTYITCRGGAPKKRYRTILSYTEESWLTRAKFAVEGVIYEVLSDTPDTEYTKIKQVPASQIVATITGCWRGEVFYKLAGESVGSSPPLSLPSRSLARSPPPRRHAATAPLARYGPPPRHSKTVAPLADQHPLETRKVWDSVSQALLSKDYGTASKNKMALEQKQRDEAEERKQKGIKFVLSLAEDESEMLTSPARRPNQIGTLPGSSTRRRRHQGMGWSTEAYGGGEAGY